MDDLSDLYHVVRRHMGKQRCPDRHLRTVNTEIYKAAVVI